MFFLNLFILPVWIAIVQANLKTEEFRETQKQKSRQ